MRKTKYQRVDRRYFTWVKAYSHNFKNGRMVAPESGKHNLKLTSNWTNTFILPHLKERDGASKVPKLTKTHKKAHNSHASPILFWVMNDGYELLHFQTRRNLKNWRLCWVWTMTKSFRLCSGWSLAGCVCLFGHSECRKLITSKTYARTHCCTCATLENSDSTESAPKEIAQDRLTTNFWGKQILLLHRCDQTGNDRW